MDEELMRYEIIHKSLRETLVPYPQWKEHVLRTENTILDIASFSNDENAGNIFMVEYPYKASALDVYTELKYGANSPAARVNAVKNVFTGEDVRNCFDAFNHRVTHFIEFQMSDALVSYIDGDYDTGVIIHSYCGAIFPFKYSELKSVTCTAISNKASLMLWAQQIIKMNNRGILYLPPYKEFQEMHKLYKNPDNFGAVVDLDFGGDNYYYAKPVVSNTISYGGTLTMKEINTAMSYMESMLAAHAKCIMML